MGGRPDSRTDGKAALKMVGSTTLEVGDKGWATLEVGKESWRSSGTIRFGYRSTQAPE